MQGFKGCFAVLAFLLSSSVLAFEEPQISHDMQCFRIVMAAGVPENFQNRLFDLAKSRGASRVAAEIAVANRLGLKGESKFFYIDQFASPYFESNLEKRTFFGWERPQRSIDPLPFFEHPLYRYGLSINESGAHRYERGGVSRKLKLFKAEFRTFSQAFARVNSGTPDTAHIFAMENKENDPSFVDVGYDGIHARYGERQEFAHVPQAFGYLRFFHQKINRDGSEPVDLYLISEIQSDFYDRLPAGRKNRYEHWDKILLLAFEKQVRLLSPTGAIEIRILDSEHIQQLWSGEKRKKSDIRPISPGLAIEIYDRLAQSLQYEPRFYGPRVIGPEGGIRKQKVQVKMTWSKSLRLGEADSLRDLVSKVVTKIENSSYQTLVDEYHQIQPAAAPIETAFKQLDLESQAEVYAIRMMMSQWLRGDDAAKDLVSLLPGEDFKKRWTETFEKHAHRLSPQSAIAIFGFVASFFDAERQADVLNIAFESLFDSNKHDDLSQSILYGFRRAKISDLKRLEILDLWLSKIKNLTEGNFDSHFRDKWDLILFRLYSENHTFIDQHELLLHQILKLAVRLKSRATVFDMIEHSQSYRFEDLQRQPGHWPAFELKLLEALRAMKEARGYAMLVLADSFDIEGDLQSPDVSELIKKADFDGMRSLRMDAISFK